VENVDHLVKQVNLFISRNNCEIARRWQPQAEWPHARPPHTPPAATFPFFRNLLEPARRPFEPICGSSSSVPFAATLSLYISRVFLSAVLAMLAGLSGLVAMFDFIELLRRAAGKTDAGFGVVMSIEALRLPWISMQILPFGVLLGGIWAFWRLTRSSELIVARAAGVSAWQFLLAPVLTAMLLGLIATAIISPISAVMRARAETLDMQYLRSGGGTMALNGGQLWLRQADHELDAGGVAILHAGSVMLREGRLEAQEVSIFRLDGADRLLERIEVSAAHLVDAGWVLDSARVVKPGGLPGPAQTRKLATNLTVRSVEESFAPPDTLSVWALPAFISLLDHSGFSSIRHRLHFQSLLALPLLAGTMSLLSAGFSMRQTRRGGVAQMIGSGVAAGFALFVVSKVAEEFGQSGALPPTLAAWAPAVAGLLLSVALLLHLEDG
jgi:lipopolysaccharide export system permease protein